MSYHHLSQKVQVALEDFILPILLQARLYLILKQYTNIRQTLILGVVLTITRLQKGKPFKKTDNLIGYVFSTDKNAYSSVSDEYVYIFKEVLGNFPLLAYGSYIGTGSYGPSAPVSLATGFFPKMLYVKSSNGSLNLFLPFTRMRTRYYESYEKVLSDNLTFGSNGNNLLICSTVSAAAQCDTANERYDWIAIG